jgi:predicted hydrocarbon binding protein
MKDLAPTKRRVFPLYYAPGKKLFHIIVKLSDAPGSYSAILNLIGPKVNLVGTTTYTLSDGTAIFSGYSEALSKNDTANQLEKLIMSSKAAIEAEVVEGSDGLLIDTFHTGIEVGGDEFMLVRRSGISLMFGHVARLLGSGGEVLLYEEGYSLGKLNAESMVKNLGKEVVRNNSAQLSHFLTAQGWGATELENGPNEDSYLVKVQDCFECSARASSRKGCDFMRGYFVGAAEASFGGKREAKEVRCALKGAPACEFLVTTKSLESI